MLQVQSGTFYFHSPFICPKVMLPYLAAGDNGKCAKHKQNNKRIKDTGEQNQHSAWFALYWNLSLIPTNL